MRKEKKLHEPTDVDTKLRHAIVSFVGISHCIPNEDKMPVSELGTTILEPLTKPAVPEEPRHGYLLGRLSLQDSSALPCSTSTSFDERGDGLTQFCISNQSFSQHKIAKQQDVVLVNCGDISPHAALHAGPPYLEEAPRLSSPMSNSSEEIITFCGRKRPEAKTLDATSQPASSAHRDRTPLGLMGSRHSNNLTGSLGTPPCEPAFRAPIRINSPCPHPLPINGTSRGGAFKGKLLYRTNRGLLTLDKRNTRNRNGTRLSRSYEALSDYIANLDEADEGNNSADDDLSDVSTAISSASGEQKINSKEESDPASFIDFYESENTQDHDHDHLTFPRTRPFLEAAVLSNQQQGLKQRRFGSRNSDPCQNNQKRHELEDEDGIDNFNSDNYICERGVAKRTQKPTVEQSPNAFELKTHSVDPTEPEGCGYPFGDGPCQSPTCLRQYPARSRGGRARARRCSSFATNYLDGPEIFGYGDFDILDRQRPSIQPRDKTGNWLKSLEYVNPELEASMQKTWENDREKKKTQKKTRKDLRQLGLLDKHGKARSTSRFGQGLSLGNVEVEVKVFLQSSRESLALPPMAHKDRKIVHEIANTLRLKSKSIGKGKNRFPVLYKTSRTSVFDDKAFDSIISRAGSARYIPRGNKYKPTRSKVGSNNAAVSYYDGEIVGAAAPEIGQDNKGRAMLEKMGWSTGTALGASNNKGIMKPVAHVVKTTKAGLG